MPTKNRWNTKRVVIAALFAALTAVSSGIRITLPLDIAGTTSFHLGNVFCALCGILLGPWLGGLAAGLGSALYDMVNPLYISECWITFLLKGLYGLIPGLIVFGKRPSYLRYLLASAAGAVAYAIAYLAKSYFYSGLLLHGLAPQAALLTVVSKLPATTFNAIIAIVIAPLAAHVIRKTLERNHLSI